MLWGAILVLQAMADVQYSIPFPICSGNHLCKLQLCALQHTATAVRHRHTTWRAHNHARLAI